MAQADKGKDRNLNGEDKALVFGSNYQGWDDDIDTVALASALNISRPKTFLAFRPRGDISNFIIFLIGDLDSVLPLSDVEKINFAPHSASRTPILTVIHSVLADAGGSLRLDELTEQVFKYLNRTIDPSPYTKSEFVYLVVRNSDHIRVSETQ
jgi:hypothetical protein